MIMKNDIREKIESLLVLSLEGQATDEHLELLNKLIDSDAEIQEYCVNYISVVSCLRSDPRISDVALREMSGNPEYDMRLWRALAETEKTASAVEIEKPQTAEELESEAVNNGKIFFPNQVSRFSLYMFMASSAAMFFILVLILLTPAKPPVAAVLYQSMGAQWGESGQILHDGDVIREGNAVLLKGLADIRFGSGAEVLVEGPADITFEGKGQIFVSYGKLSSRVPKSAIGFTVRTPEAVVVDYGTEFGVLVNKDGMTETHVFDGEVELRSGSNPLVFEKSSRITQGQAKRINTSMGQIQDIEIRNRTFARRLCPDTEFVWHGENLDMADLVGGGNGFGSGLLGCGIDINFGGLFAYNDLLIQGWVIEDTYVRPKTETFTSNGQYTPVQSNTYIDGVFVPDGGSGRCVVSTAGHLFEGCPDTSGNYYIGVINSGSLLRSRSAENAVNLYGLHNMSLEGKSYGTRQNPGLFVHSNMGITFDLDAIRRSLPGISVTTFTSLCGISDKDTNMNSSDFWVLIDGIKRFEATGKNKVDGAMQIEIPLTSDDRFLTLATTESDGNIGSDWCIFAKPTLVLESE